MIMRQCIYACSHLETALQIAREEPAFEGLLEPLCHALEELKGLQEKVGRYARTQTNVEKLMERLQDMQSK